MRRFWVRGNDGVKDLGFKHDERPFRITATSDSVMYVDIQ
jgi:hypothetical protein